MDRRKIVIYSVLAGALGLPIIFGASCPPPDSPPFVSIVQPGSSVSQDVPNCETGRVCITIMNQTCVDTDIILYIQDGYDLTGQYATRTALECCESPNATNPCPCFNPGSDTGELQLVPPQLFTPQNRFPIANNEVIYELKGRVDQLSALGGRVTVNLRCEEVKNIGLQIGLVGEMPGTVQEQVGVDYRCTMVNTDRGTAGRPEDVACGGTIQYTIVDRNDCVNQDLTVFRIETAVSADCTGVTPAASGSGGTGGGGGGGMGGG
jgi:hypothetical protein